MVSGSFPMGGYVTDVKSKPSSTPAAVLPLLTSLFPGEIPPDTKKERKKRRQDLPEARQSWPLALLLYLLSVSLHLIHQSWSGREADLTGLWQDQLWWLLGVQCCGPWRGQRSRLKWRVSVLFSEKRLPNRELVTLPAVRALKDLFKDPTEKNTESQSNIWAATDSACVVFNIVVGCTKAEAKHERLYQHLAQDPKYCGSKDGTIHLIHDAIQYTILVPFKQYKTENKLVVVNLKISF